VVYCGEDRINWSKFAIAVELFVEVETATHRLSEVMKKDPRFYHVPGWFEYVSALGASLLVDATGRLFRDYKLETARTEPKSLYNTEDEADSDSGPEKLFDEHGKHRTSSKIMQYRRGQPLLNLEYLVSSLSIFDVSMEHDTIYALLAIAKDTSPSAGDEKRMLEHTENVLQDFMQKKRYKVEYQRPYVDVCKEFVNFCIERSISTDATRALDIICRPWATEKRRKIKSKIQSATSQVSFEAGTDLVDNENSNRLETLPKPERCVLFRKVSAELNQKMTERLIKIWTKDKTDTTRFPKLNESEKEERQPGFWTDFWRTWSKNEKRAFWESWSEVLDQELPSWIPQLSGASYAMLPHAGVHTLKMARKNSDSLVGFPSLTQRNYNAAETKKLDTTTLKFRKRPSMDKFSMYVHGFVLDEIESIQDSSQNGSIPKEWADVGGWTQIEKRPPPDEFWRTLVADRGRDGRNPPVYYSRACQESFMKGGHESGSVNTTDLINNERCSVVAQFCRRVQSVIWNRSLVMTKSQKLGLVGKNVKKGDLICIFYGCSVPVVIRRNLKKTDAEVDQEIDEEIRNRRLEILNRWKDFSKRAQAFRGKREEGKAIYAKWEDRKREEWKAAESWQKTWGQRQKEEKEDLKNYHSPRAPNTELNEAKEKWCSEWEKKQLVNLKNTVFGDDFDDLSHYRSILHSNTTDDVNIKDIAWLAEWETSWLSVGSQATTTGRNGGIGQMNATDHKKWLEAWLADWKKSCVPEESLATATVRKVSVRQMNAVDRKAWLDNLDRVLKHWEDCRLKEIRDTHRDRDHGDSKVESFLMDDEDYKRFESLQLSQDQASMEDEEWYRKQKSRLDALKEYHGEKTFESLVEVMKNPWWSSRQWWLKPEYWKMEEQKKKQRQAYEKLDDKHKAIPWATGNESWWEEWKSLMTTSDIQKALQKKRTQQAKEHLMVIRARLKKVETQLGLPAMIWASLSARRPVCQMLAALSDQWAPHREYLQSQSLMERDREFNAWKQKERQRMMQEQKDWERDKKIAEAEEELERKTRVHKKRRVDGHSSGSRIGAGTFERKTSPKDKWGEPFPNWKEFELFLKYGRRWRYGRRWKLALKQLEELQRREDGTFPAAKDPTPTPTPVAQDHIPREPALPKPSLTNTEEYNPAILIHQPRTQNEEEIAGKIRKKLYKNKEQVIEDGWWSYEFLGECYIHGMMDGEAMAFQNETAQPAQIFELR